MGRITLIVIAVTTVSPAAGPIKGTPDEPERPAPTTFPKKALVEDFRQMREVLEQNHDALY